MTQNEFNNINEIFNEYVKDHHLSETIGVIDEKSILDRVYEKVGDKINNNYLPYFLLLNIHMLNEQYESAQDMKNFILNKF
jgi:hypothetical protein